MRTRARTTLINAPTPARAATVTFPTGYYPWRVNAWSPVSDGTVPTILQSNSETIVDEFGTTADKVKGVSHVKRETSKVPYQKYVSTFSIIAGEGPYWMSSADQSSGLLSLRRWRPSWIREGYTPAVSCWNDASTRFSSVLSSITDVDPYLSKEPSPVLASNGDLPARIIRQMESVHLTTSAIEARELPALYRWLGKRARLAAMPQALLRNLFSKRGVRSWSTKEWIAFWRDNQLGYTFGLMPTVRDAYDISSEIARHRKPRRRRFVVTNTKTKQVNVAKAYTAQAPQPRYTVTENREYLSVAGCRVTSNRPPPDSDYFSQARDVLDRFIGKNPLGLIWEVLPLSFAIDWLVSVDDCLDTIWLNRQTEYRLEYWTSLKKSVIRELELQCVESWDRVFYTDPVFTYSDPSSFTHRWSSYTRSPVGPPSPLDSVRLRGANVYNTYLTLLIGSGMITGKSKVPRLGASRL